MKRKLAIGATVALLVPTAALIAVLRSRTVVDEREVSDALGYFEGARSRAEPRCERPRLPEAVEPLAAADAIDASDFLQHRGPFARCISFDRDDGEEALLPSSFESSLAPLPQRTATPPDWPGPLDGTDASVSPMLRTLARSCEDAVLGARAAVAAGGRGCGPNPNPSLDSALALSGLGDGIRAWARTQLANGAHHEALATLVDGIVLLEDLAAGEPSLLLATTVIHAMRGLIEELHGLLAFELELDAEEHADLAARLRVAEANYPHPTDSLVHEARVVGAMLRSARSSRESDRAIVAAHAVHQELHDACEQTTNWGRCWQELTAMKRRPQTVSTVPGWVRALLGDASDRDAMRAHDRELVTERILLNFREQAFVYVALRGLRPLLALHGARTAGCRAATELPASVLEAPSVGGPYAVSQLDDGRLVLDAPASLEEGAPLPVFVMPCPPLDLDLDDR